MLKKKINGVQCPSAFGLTLFNGYISFVINLSLGCNQTRFQFGMCCFIKSPPVLSILLSSGFTDITVDGSLWAAVRKPRCPVAGHGGHDVRVVNIDDTSEPGRRAYAWGCRRGWVRGHFRDGCHYSHSFWRPLLKCKLFWISVALASPKFSFNFPCCHSYVLPVAIHCNPKNLERYFGLTHKTFLNL